MSYNFQINKKNTLTYKDLLDLVDFQIDEIKYQPLLENHHALNTHSIFFLPQFSTRGVNLKDKENKYWVEINTGCSGEDYFLAAKLASALANLNNSEIQTDEGSYTIENFSRHFNLEWAHQNKTHNIEILRSVIEKDSASSIILNGYHIPFYFGKEVLKEYSGDNPSIEILADRIINGIKRNQHLESEFENIEFPTKMEMENNDKSLENWTFLLIQSGFRQLIKPADFIILRHEQDFARIPYETFIKENLHLLTKIDEKQFVIDVIAQNDYLNLIAQFKLESSENSQKENTHGINDTPKPNPITPKNKWWKFW
ncbi:hypothetical protein [Chryseobacterium sp.]|uniref:hypothetical protein n=1 Tax=Chryseobacterium sp. TaxID=1871047 RepID=UPI0025B93037|nr:hypothetical protein [Chryseobacterium sp.]MBV8328012.1 hypothetical protein [Chryseobacterium sp.]